MPDRLPLPWSVHNNESSYWVEDASGRRFAFVYYRDQQMIGTVSDGMSRDLARRITANVARLPDLLRTLEMGGWRQEDLSKGAR
jgi:hypothetical protein